MSREPIPTWYFVLVVVKKNDKFLLVHEKKHEQLWYLPAGRVEAGEDLITAAKRETMEEAGIPIVIDGIFKIQHTPNLQNVRMRIIFCAIPQDDTAPKSIPDEESLEADWFTLEEIRQLPLRSFEVFRICSQINDGAIVASIDLLGSE